MLWELLLQEVKGRLRPLFTQKCVATMANDFLDALLGNEPHKTDWMRTEAAGAPSPWRQQALLELGHWEADALRDTDREYVAEHLTSDEVVLVIDETAFLRKGNSSC